jgi:hypothetical protein
LRRNSAAAAAGLLAAALFLGGCATAEGGVDGTLGRAMEQTSSAAATAELALDVHLQDRSIKGLTDSALQDALKETTDAATNVAEAEPNNRKESTDRAAARDLAFTAVALLNQAQDLVQADNRGAETAAVAAELGRLAERLDAAAKEWLP